MLGGVDVVSTGLGMVDCQSRWDRSQSVALEQAGHGVAYLLSWLIQSWSMDVEETTCRKSCSTATEAAWHVS